MVALASSPHLAGLEVLDLRDNAVYVDGDEEGASGHVPLMPVARAELTKRFGKRLLL